MGVGQNSSGLLLREEVRLVVGLSGGGGGWSWGESQVGAWAGLEAGVELWLTDFKLLQQHTPFTIVAVCGWYFL